MRYTLTIALIVLGFLTGCVNRGWQETVGPSPTFFAVDRDDFDSDEDYRFAEANWFWGQLSDADVVFVSCSIRDELSAMVRDCNRIADQVRRVVYGTDNATPPKIIVSLDVPSTSGVSIQEAVDNHEKNVEIIEVNRRTGRGGSTRKFEQEEALYQYTTFLPMNLTPEHQEIWEERMQGEYIMPSSFAGVSERDDIQQWITIWARGTSATELGWYRSGSRVNVSWTRQDGVIEVCRAALSNPFTLRVTHHRCESAKDSEWYKRADKI